MKPNYFRLVRAPLLVLVLGLASSMAEPESNLSKNPLGEAYRQAVQSGQPVMSRFASEQQQQNASPSGNVLEPSSQAFPVGVTVMDQQGFPVLDLKKENFEVYEDGVKQQVFKFDLAQDGPVTVALLFEWRVFFPECRGYEYYSRMCNEQYNILRQIYLSAGDGISMLDNPEDRIAIFAYNDYAMSDCSKIEDDKKRTNCYEEDDERFNNEVVIAFTRNKEAAATALAEKVGQGGVPYYSRYTQLYDTVARILDSKFRDFPGRKNLIIVGTGMDNSGISQTSRNQLLRLASQTGAPIFTIGTGKEFWDSWFDYYFPNRDPMGDIAHRIPPSSDFQMGDSLLKQLSDKTGGQHYTIRAPEEISDKYQKIFSALKNQYLLSYIPTNKLADGKIHKIEVKLIQVGDDGKPVLDKNGNPAPLTEILDDTVKKGKKPKKLKLKIYATPGRQAPNL